MLHGANQEKGVSKEIKGTKVTDDIECDGSDLP
jgi:hypothetical protein